MNLDEKFRQYKLNTYLPEEETMQRPESLPSPDIVSQLVTEGVSSVVSDIEKMPAQSLYALGKGAIEGAVGTPGDLISIIKGIYYASNTPEGKNKLDEFTRGMESSTVLPTTEDVKKFINELVPQLQTKATAAESTGELFAPSGLATYATKNVVKGVKKITKVLK